MPYICPRCEECQDSINHLSVHIRYKYGGTLHSQWHCKQIGCIRVFADIYSFKKHLKSKHFHLAEPKLVANSQEHVQQNIIDKTLYHNTPYNEEPEILEEMSSEAMRNISTITEF